MMFEFGSQCHIKGIITSETGHARLTIAAILQIKTPENGIPWENFAPKYHCTS